MPKKHFVTIGDGVPKAVSPISQAVVVGDTCYVSGQLPVDPHGCFQNESVERQAALALKNLVCVIEAAGFLLQDIVYIDVALIDIGDMSAINNLFAETFAEGRWPARTVYQAAALPQGSRIKLQAIACRDGA
jgi:2-iminobutanoate/2-iminopropanoate deaminase